MPPRSLSAESTTPEQLAKRYATSEYYDLMLAVDEKLTPHHNLTYVPFILEQQLRGVEHLEYKTEQDLPAIMKEADVVVCISRDENLNPYYTDQYPERNITLTPSGIANVDRSVELFQMAKGRRQY